MCKNLYIHFVSLKYSFLTCIINFAWFLDDESISMELPRFQAKPRLHPKHVLLLFSLSCTVSDMFFDITVLEVKMPILFQLSVLQVSQEHSVRYASAHWLRSLIHWSPVGHRVCACRICNTFMITLKSRLSFYISLKNSKNYFCIFYS